MSENALHSLRDATRVRKRKQVVYTPQAVVDVLLTLWPEGIALDPCSGPDSIVPAARSIMPPDDGLAIDWPERT